MPRGTGDGVVPSTGIGSAIDDTIRARGRAEPLDLAIARIGEERDRVISRRELLALGASRNEIQHRLEQRRLVRIHPGVYAIGPGRLTDRGRFRAAVEAGGARAVLSHRAAARHLGLRLQFPARIEITIPGRGRRRIESLIVHATRSLPPEEIVVAEGIRCTSWARTIIDNAGTLGPRDVDRMLERSTILRIFDLHEMNAALANANGRAGAGVVRALLGSLADEAPPTRLELERRFLELIRDHGLPAPIVNAQVEGHEVDFHWPHAKLIVETDGRQTHDTPYAFERDRARDLDLELAGWHVIRVTWRQVTEEPRRVARLIGARLAHPAPAI